MINTNLWTRLLLLQPAEEDYEDFFYLCSTRGCGTRDGILKMEINKRGKKIRKQKLLADGFALFLSSAVFSRLPTLPAVALLFPVSAGVVSPSCQTSCQSTVIHLHDRDSHDQLISKEFTSAV